MNKLKTLTTIIVTNLIIFSQSIVLAKNPQPSSGGSGISPKPLKGTALDKWNEIWSVVLLVGNLLGVALIFFGAILLIISFVSDAPEKKTLGIKVVAAGIGVLALMVAAPSLLKL